MRSNRHRYEELSTVAKGEIRRKRKGFLKEKIAEIETAHQRNKTKKLVRNPLHFLLTQTKSMLGHEWKHPCGRKGQTGMMEATLSIVT